MAVAGVIAEYNPFHRGHAWQLEELRRRLGTDVPVVACMSGNFVQRGDFALLNKHSRAEMALMGGVDLVLELPTPWAAAGAERFAQGAVAVLAASGVVTHLAFGCESGELAPLQAAEEGLERAEYPEKLREIAGKGISFAAARQQALEELSGAAGCLSRPNNALAVEYLRALRAQGSLMEPLALPRVGAGHDSGVICAYPSASAIREAVLGGEDWRALLPEESGAVLSREIAAGRSPACWKNCQRAILARLRSMEEEDFRLYDGGNEGLYHRFYAAVHSAATVEELLSRAKTKRYPMARLRRMLVQAYLGVPQASQGETPPYIRVLGAGPRGRELLGQMRKSASLPVVIRPGSVRRMGEEIQRVFDRESRCTDLYALACPDLRRALPEREYASGPVMR